MSALYMLDTNIVSYLVRNEKPTLRRRVESVSAHTRLCVSAVTEGEIRYGMRKRALGERARAAIETYLSGFDSLPWDSTAAQAYGDLRAAQESKGNPLGNLDLLIAAHAVATGAVLVTNDRSFARVKGLTVENWAA